MKVLEKVHFSKDRIDAIGALEGTIIIIANYLNY